MKTCNTCHEDKPVSEFYHRSDRAGYRPNCKECFRACNNKTKGRARGAAIKEKDAISRNPHGFLAADIIEKAIRDWRRHGGGNDKDATEYDEIMTMVRQRGYETIREELLAFFASAWFEELASMADCSPEYLRKHILNVDG